MTKNENFQICLKSPKTRFYALLSSFRVFWSILAKFRIFRESQFLAQNDRFLQNLKNRKFLSSRRPSLVAQKSGTISKQIKILTRGQGAVPQNSSIGEFTFWRLKVKNRHFWGVRTHQKSQNSDFQSKKSIFRILANMKSSDFFLLEGPRVKIGRKIDFV